MASNPAEGPSDDETKPMDSGSAPPSSRASRGLSRESERVAAPSHALALGSRYQFVSEGASGGMGTVAEAHDTLLDRKVAIKFLHRAGGGTERARLVREARAMAALRHHAICRVLEVVIDPPISIDPDAWRPFLVMEWVAGQPLSTAWRGLPFERRIDLFVAIAEGVAAMHSLGLVHRDLKPSNILCDQSGNPVIVDFGLSARQGEGGEQLGGTPGWSAPEQFEAGSEVGPAADVFSLGVLFYNMLTDALPFEGASTVEILKKTREGDAPLPETHVPGISASLQRIALAAIDPVPAQRYADVSLMLADIRRFKAGETVLARPRQLFTRFADEVERHLSDAERWQKQGLATEQEVRPIIDGLLVLQRPESAWVLDSRRLSASQVSLYFGGWLLVLALTVGVWNTSDLWRDQGAALPWLVPAVLAGVVTVVGLFLARIGEQRTALGFLFTSTLALPIALWQLMRTNDWLAAGEGPVRTDLVTARSIGLSNDQQLAIAGFGIVVAAIYRRYTPSSAFTLMATFYAFWLAFAVGLRYFELDSAERIFLGQVGAWMLLPSALLVMAGVRLDARSNRPARDLLSVEGPRDGGPVLVTALVLLVAALSLLAVEVPEWYWFGESPADAQGRVSRSADPESRALAFLLVGFVVFALSAWLRSRPTPLRDWCSRALRWLVPSFLVIPLVWLEIDGAAPGWQFWMAVLAVTSVGLVALSSILQWRPFLVSGLLATTDLVVRGFYRLDRDFEDSPGANLSMMLGLALVGLVVMFLASYPDRVARGARDIARGLAARLSRVG